jgi:hypothetical protein
MKNKQYNPLTLLSIFRRKGGEGARTKVIDEYNRINYLPQMEILEIGEKPLICYNQEEERRWILLTDLRIVEKTSRGISSILYSELVEVNIAMNEEYKVNEFNKANFTFLHLKNIAGEKFLIQLEKGKPYQGIYQLLHYIMSYNKSNP